VASNEDVLLAIGELKGEVSGIKTMQKSQGDMITRIDDRVHKNSVDGAKAGAKYGAAASVFVSVGVTMLTESIKNAVKNG